MWEFWKWIITSVKRVLHSTTALENYTLSFPKQEKNQKVKLLLIGPTNRPVIGPVGETDNCHIVTFEFGPKLLTFPEYILQLPVIEPEISILLG